MGPTGEGTLPGAESWAEVSFADLYRERAAALARPAAEASGWIRGEKVILFELGEETYGLPIRTVERIFAQPIRIPAPGVGRRWAGVFAVQGEIVPILHLARVLDLPETVPDANEYVLGLRAMGRKLGLLTGRALEVREVPMGSLRLAGSQARYLKGIGPDNELILDVDLLTEQEFSI